MVVTFGIKSTYLLTFLCCFAVAFSSDSFVWTRTASDVDALWYSYVSISSSGQYALASGYTSGYVLVSTQNFGSSWSICSANNDYTAAVAVSSTGQYMYALSLADSLADVLLRSSNYGVSFNATETTFALYMDAGSLACSSDGSVVVIAAAGDTLEKSTDYGVTFTTVYSFSAESTFVACDTSCTFIFVGAYNGASLYISSDGGLTFSAVGPTEDWWNIAMDSSGQYLMAASESTGSWVSTNYGSTWLPANVSVSSYELVTCSSTGQYMTIASQSGELYVSNNYGSTWSVGWSSSNYEYISADSSGQVLLVIQENALYLGFNASFIPTTLPTMKPIVVTTVPSLIPSINPSVLPSTLIPTAAPSTQIPTIEPSNAVEYSWQLVKESTIFASLSDLATSDSGQYVIGCSADGVIVSADYGSSWTIVSTLSSSYVWSGVSVSGNGSFMAACAGNEHDAYVSSDYGVTWKVLGITYSDYESIAVDATGQNIVLVGAALYYSSDFGNSFTTATGSYNFEYAYISKGGPYAIAVTNIDGIFVSGDSGSSWTLCLSSPLDFRYGFISSEGQYLMAATNDGIVYYSTNGGSSWQSSSISTSNIYSLSASISGQFVFIEGSTLFMSSNYGQTFTSIYSTCGYGQVSASSSAGTLICISSGDNAYLGIDSNLTNVPSHFPTAYPSISAPTIFPSIILSETPTMTPSVTNTSSPSSIIPTIEPTPLPTPMPSELPSSQPVTTTMPSISPTLSPTDAPSVEPTKIPTIIPSISSSFQPSSDCPSITPSIVPSNAPSSTPTFLQIPTQSPTITFNYNYTWTNIFYGTYFVDADDLASSDDGQYLLASSTNCVLISRDFGSSWSQAPLSNNTYWTGVSLSSNGSVMGACAEGSTSYGSVWVTTNFGMTWLDVTPMNTYDWLSIAVDMTGEHIVAAAYNEPLYYSSNFGTTWSIAESAKDWWLVYMSHGGAYAIAVTESSDGIFISSDSGASWTSTTAQALEYRYGSISSNGQYLVAGVWTGGIYYSLDGGSSWAPSSVDLVSVYALAASSSGQIVAAVLESIVYISNNYGVTFEQSSGAPGGSLLCMGSSGSPVVVIYGYNVYNGVDSALAIVPSLSPSVSPSIWSTSVPTTSTVSSGMPTLSTSTPTFQPTEIPTAMLAPTFTPTEAPSISSTSLVVPSNEPTEPPSSRTVTSQPTDFPTPGPELPTLLPTIQPTNSELFTYNWSEAIGVGIDWSSVASDGSGQYLISTEYEGGIYYSQDFGDTWLQSDAPKDLEWTSVACSSNGSFAVAVALKSAAFVSYNYGMGWNMSYSSQLKWTSVAMSEDGSLLALSASANQIYISTDFGRSFEAFGHQEMWQSVSVSSDSSHLVAVVADGGIYVSSDSGHNWDSTSAPTASWSSVTISNTGQIISACANNGGIYYSHDFGGTWNFSDATIGNWVSISSNIAGAVMFAAIDDGQIYVSNNFGVNWSISADSNSTSWTSLASNEDGGQVVGVTDGDGISIGITSDYPTPTPSAAPVSFYPTLKPSKQSVTFSPTVANSLIWNTSDAPNSVWTGISASTTGQYVVAIAKSTGDYTGGIYYSTDYGYMWSQSKSGSSEWLSVDSSSSGQYVVAGTAASGVYYSSDYGRSWNMSAGTATESWNALAVTSTGQTVYAATNNFVWKSTNFGNSWSQLSTMNTNWISITCDDLGVNIAAAAQNSIYYSQDSGVTWTISPDTENIAWSALVSNSTGQLVVATADVQGILFKSEDYGRNWTELPAPSLTTVWTALCMDSSGQRLGLTTTYPDSDFVYVSTTSGSSWTASTVYQYQWNAIAMNGNGNMMISAIYGESIFVGNGNTSLVVIVSAPTMNPTLNVNSIGQTQVGLYSNTITVGSFLICVPGVVVLVGRLLLLWARLHVDKSILNQLSNMYWEAIESVFRAVNVMLSFNSLVVAFHDHERQTTALLLLSRLFVVVVWLMFLCILTLPISTSAFPFANLSLYLNDNVMRQKLTIRFFAIGAVPIAMRYIAMGGIMAGVFDLTILRLLPWTSSEFTTAVQGYPNMFAVRCCLYGTFLSTLLQSISSIASLAQNHNGEALIFLFVSLFNTMLSLLSVVLFMQLATTSTLQVSIVFKTKEASKEEDIEMQDINEKEVKEDELESNAQEDIVTEVVNPIFIENATVEVMEPRPVEVIPAKVEKIHSPIHAVVDDYVVDERSIRFSTGIEYAEQTMEILKEQLSKKGENPLQYIPLPRLKAELESIFSAANNGIPYDEARLDYLLTCMDYNPEYKREKAAEDQQWRETMKEFSSECLRTMKSFIPPNIFHSSVESLKNDCKYSPDLAKRLFTKKCLWVIRIVASDIERIHIAELLGRFNPQAQGLDIVELAAIYAAVPPNFGRDHKKEAWRLSLEKQLKDLEKDRQANKLIGAKKRHPAYKNQTGIFEEIDDMHSMEAVSGDAFGTRESFKHLKSIVSPVEKEVETATTTTVINDSEEESERRPVSKRDNFEALSAKLNANLLSRNQK